MINNSTTWATFFTIDSSAPKVDLIAATANKACPGEYGVVIDVTDKIFEVPSGVQWSGGKWTNNTCVVVATSTPTATPDPCRVHIDKAAVSGMEASITARICLGIVPPDYCPEDENSAIKQVALAGICCLLAAVGALGFFLA
ncbi:uncharacterized protein N7498_008382 [Penicillium cinerascens]|uniref:DUF7136 domain-containing protein n=1 Tax=Penicillium cinerascens TaxID=70096 RepID=A0A9W9JEL5_9EURO|nr:uncharacterized protein N7498_008382 [Penicillium cinerascens]KAJ5194944.1 hypothetical protein N7498_008382 [Penicillium cinerascens]